MYAKFVKKAIKRKKKRGDAKWKRKENAKCQFLTSGRKKERWGGGHVIRSKIFARLIRKTREREHNFPRKKNTLAPSPLPWHDGKKKKGSSRRLKKKKEESTTKRKLSCDLIQKKKRGNTFGGGRRTTGIDLDKFSLTCCSIPQDGAVSRRQPPWAAYRILVWNQNAHTRTIMPSLFPLPFSLRSVPRRKKKKKENRSSFLHTRA